MKDTRDNFYFSILSHNLGRSSGTTDEFATIPFHIVLFSAALVELTKSIPAHSLILSSRLFFCLHLLSLHQCVSGADFSLTEQSLSRLFMTVWLALVMNRGRGKPRKQKLFFRQLATPVENSSNIYLIFITNYKKKHKAK